MKRIFDFTVALLGLLILSPLIIVICLLVKVTSKGPVFFKQTRVGLNKKDFKVLKFRSMTVVKDNDRFDAGDSSRVTKIGKFIRKAKIDELPQLINVVRGDMSLVGPRPEIRRWVDCYPERWEKVLSVLPGITDSASIEFRNEEEILACSDDPQLTYRDEILPMKLSFYEKYIEEKSFCGDIIIIFRTIRAVFKG